MTDLPACPPPGASAVFPLPVIAASGGGANLSGLIVHGDGRVSIAHRGAGLAVRLAAEDAAALALLLWQLAGQIAERDQHAADAADAELNRIVAERSTDA